MPRTIDYRKEGAVVEYTGIVTLDDFLGLNAEVLAHDYATGKPRYALLDFSRSDRVDLSSSDLQRIAEEDERDAELIAGTAVLIVAPQTLTYGLARMWEGLVDPLSLESMVVRTRPEAEAWLAARELDLG
jgi:hypothetical protein